MLPQPSAPVLPNPSIMRDIPEIMVQYDILNKKIAEINLHRESPDMAMKRKEQLLRKNYYRQYISRQDSAS